MLLFLVFLTTGPCKRDQHNYSCSLKRFGSGNMQGREARISTKGKTPIFKDLAGDILMNYLFLRSQCLKACSGSRPKSNVLLKN